MHCFYFDGSSTTSLSFSNGASSCFSFSFFSISFLSGARAGTGAGTNTGTDACAKSYERYSGDKSLLKDGGIYYSLEST